MVNNRITNNEEKIKLSFREKIMKFLIENREPLSILQISDRLGADYKNTFQTIKSYPDIILQEKKGNTNFIKIKLAPNPEIHSIEIKRTREFVQKNKQMKLVREDIASLNYPFFIVLVFGSFVKKTNTAKSDIDLCIICDNKPKTRQLISKLKLLPLKLEIHEFTSEEFESMLKQKAANVANEITKSNIILYGIENYYNIISKWMKKD